MSIRLNKVNKSYDRNSILKDLSIEITKGEFTVLSGSSGAGKSTLLNIIGMLESYDSGSVCIDDSEIPKPFSRQSERMLKNRIGYLFQDFALVDNCTVRYNLEIAVDKRKTKADVILLKIKDALESVGLSGFEDKIVSTCSGGEQQRVALARLLIKDCDIVLCDEPTGSLDDINADIIISLLKSMQAQGKTVVIATHDSKVCAVADRIIEIHKLPNESNIT